RAGLSGIVSRVPLMPPAATDDGASFTLPDGGYTRVALAHELRQPRVVPFDRREGLWELRLDRPPVDRVEYLLELQHADGRTEWVTDPANPLRAPGAFGEKSVVEFPEYAAPSWVDDDQSATGVLVERELPS